MDDLFQTALRGGEDTTTTVHYHRGHFHKKYDSDVNRFVELYQQYDLVEFVENRQPSLLPKVGESKIDLPFAVGQDIKKKCSNLDNWLRIGEQTRNRNFLN